jgi:DNA-binding HxlR family transcriptional regulator
VSGFRYPQFCALARAAELIGQRWTLLVLRELCGGPQRSADLREHLAGVSPSVLTERLGELQERGLVLQRQLAPPGRASVYELTSSGRALEPALTELTRWGARFLLPLHEGDQFEPGWVPGALAALARRGPTPSFALEVHVPDGAAEHVVWVAGGRRGTQVTREPRRVDATLRAPGPELLALATGTLDPAEAERSGRLQFEGDRAVLHALCDLFDASILSPEASQE